jgi:hypothetical protein
MGSKRSRLTEQCLIHLKLRGTSSTPVMVHVRFIDPLCGLILAPILVIDLPLARHPPRLVLVYMMLDYGNPE